jgi:hypothetical protein
MREIHAHEINDFNRNNVVVRAMDGNGPGGASHLYHISIGIVERTDENPTGASCMVNFQNGPIKEAGVNGVTDEALLAILIDRLQGFQRGQYSCRENALALTKMEEAMHWLQHRTRERERRGVEGTHQV